MGRFFLLRLLLLYFASFPVHCACQIAIWDVCADEWASLSNWIIKIPLAHCTSLKNTASHYISLSPVPFVSISRRTVLCSSETLAAPKSWGRGFLTFQVDIIYKLCKWLRQLYTWYSHLRRSYDSFKSQQHIKSLLLARTLFIRSHFCVDSVQVHNCKHAIMVFNPDGAVIYSVYSGNFLSFSQRNHLCTRRAIYIYINAWTNIYLRLMRIKWFVCKVCAFDSNQC